MPATETLKKSRSIQFNIVLDEKALMNALGNKPLEVDDEEEKEGSAVKLLKQSRTEETPIVKMSQVPMAG